LFNLFQVLSNIYFIWFSLQILLAKNKDYAKTYNILRKKELLQKCKLKNRVLRSFAISQLYHLIFLR